MAEPIAVDRIEITVLVDNVTDSLSTTPSFVTREWIRLQRQGMKRTMGGALCCANHGLSLVVRADIAGKSRTVLCQSIRTTAKGFLTSCATSAANIPSEESLSRSLSSSSVRSSREDNRARPSAAVAAPSSSARPAPSAPKA